MNIFISNPCPIESARNLDVVRQNKMLLESCQLLSTAVNYHGGKAPYKTTHLNHPSSIWTRTNKANYTWVLNHAIELSRLYTLRTNKIHGCAKVLDQLIDLTHYLPHGDITPFANCARNLSKGVDFTQILDVPLAYQLYLSKRWETDSREPTFFRGEI
jgi:hypothetical protein